MAKNNPVDAHRKAQRKAELKKNKAARSKQKEVATIKKDVRPIEAEIRQLTQKAQQAPLSKADKDELASLRAELARITKAKNEYVEAHPEHRKFVFPAGSSGAEGGAGENGGAAADEPAGLYDRNGRLKHPERSIYYHPEFNPFGVPPPGMPYREKPEYEMVRLGFPTPDQLAAFQPQVEEGSDDEDSDDDEDEDDDIVMPDGPPPTGKAAGPSSSDSDSDDDDDDIALPPGLPPPKPVAQPPSGPASRPLISRPTSARPPPHFPPPIAPHIPHALPSRPSFPTPPPAPSLPPPTNAPSGPRNPNLPARPPPPTEHMSDPLNADPNKGPQRAFQQGRPAGPPPGAVITAAPTPPASGPSPFLPIPGATAAAASTAGGGATISAAPQLRDLKKEATAFVPTAMRKKMAQQKAQLAKVGLAAVNAAPAAEGGEGGVGGGERKKTLMEEMWERGIGVGPAVGVGGAAGQGGEENKKKTQGDEDYKRFEQEMSEFL